MTIDEIAALLPGSKRVRRGGFVSTCPSHEDNKPSLSFKQGDKGIVVHCFAGCTAADVTAALGLTVADLFNDEPDPVVINRQRPRRTKYQIRDVDGALRAVHERVDRAGGKDFYWYRPDGTPGLNGTAPDDLPLYGTELIASWPAGSLPLIVEGEKDADAVRSAGLPGLGTLGASTSPSAVALGPLSGSAVILAPDNDDAGRHHMQRVATVLEDVAAVGWLEWPDVPVKGGAADYLATHTAEDLRQLLATARAWPLDDPEPGDDGLEERDAMSLVDAVIRELDQPIPGVLSEGIGVLSAPPKTGKTWLAYQISVELVFSGELLGVTVDRRDVLYYALEDGPRRAQDRIRRLLKGRRAGLEHLLIRYVAPKLGGPLEAEIAEWLDAHPRGVVIVDILAKVRAAPSKSGRNAYDQDYSDAAELHNVVRRRPGSTILLVTHDRKAGAEDWVTRVTGTRGITGGADFVIFIDRKRSDTTGRIHVTGRDVEDETFDAEFDSSGWRLADIEQVIGRKSETRQTIFNWVRENGPAWQKAIAEGTGLSETVVKNRVADMAKDEELVGGPEGYSVPT